jgi:tetratricopeptide (TPR) repeat protein
MSVFDRLFGKGGASTSEAAAIADMNEAVSLYRKGGYREALEIADRLIKAGPEIPLSWRFRGECLFALGRYSDAVAAFDKASAIGGRGTEDVFLWTALALHNGGDPANAKARLKAALAGGGLTPELRARTEQALRQLESA